MAQGPRNHWNRVGIALVTACVAPGCVVDPHGTVPLHTAQLHAEVNPVSRDTFAAEAGPLLEKRCGDAMCHGRPERPLAMYAVGARRLDPTKTHLKVPLTEAEINANYTSILGFLDADHPRATTLLQKATGHLGHKGGPVFAAASDPECAAIIAWILGKELP